ncbi:hypothetical protein LXA43DRAFT_1091909 [Ganoderma leucocontextum]|nr:hypothetical protein LXA43DRAFT_1091909 [Ganoderma leucocontextum]
MDSDLPPAPQLIMDSDLPPAPQIDGEAMLEIFRLAILGGKALDTAYTRILFDKRPMMTADALDSHVRKLPELIEKWVEGYKWWEKVRHANDIDIRTPEETRYLMDAYVGAVFVRNGYWAVLDWITALVTSV